MTWGLMGLSSGPDRGGIQLVSQNHRLRLHRSAFPLCLTKFTAGSAVGFLVGQEMVELEEGVVEDLDAAGDVGGAGPLLGDVAEAVAAGDEDHRGRHEAGQDGGVVA